MTDTQTPEAVLVDTPAEGVARITLNRPDSLNAFTFDMYEALIAAFEGLRDDPDVRVIVLTGAGRAFCAGHDVRVGGKPAWVRPGLGRIQAGKYTMRVLGQIPVLMRAMPQPIICAVNGTAAGIGYALALASDMTIAARSAKFVNVIHNAATGAELGMSYLLPRAIGAQRAAELLLTARAVQSDEAERIGLVLRAVDDAALMDEALALADAVAVNSPVGIWLTKQSLWFNQGAGSLEAAIELENRAVLASQATEDAAEKRASAVEKRRPKFKHT
ncbi:enoyl-CoA hydratase/isomerase family protein [Caulobacter rhizosphaerae]|jgi:enoyl-CoA hydratase|uniref:enoyl-CoA hydratase/isomerase family protein n=1 Tax=Caulobacter rhizosphaerae TaxID=2010972 RepID=UPI0013D2F0D7|nr:enoyl-CoA hydratase-related protein [Caulobacter rhizosphaerae]GGL47146.1 putative enoyl-CoA hydratase/isomerase [Caulobacter rhizosphaerae]